MPKNFIGYVYYTDDEEQVEVVSFAFPFIKLFLPFCDLFLNFHGILVFFHGEPPLSFFEHKHYTKYSAQVNTLGPNTAHNAARVSFQTLFEWRRSMSEKNAAEPFFRAEAHGSGENAGCG
ncbi:MAG: hypothetical protein IKD72_09710 [Clostridia bacterium]|nr:hypothetical protein [Clostridia bacterium]